MSDLPPPPDSASRRNPWYHWRRLGFNFLTLSVLAHLFFGAVATYFVVQVIQPKRSPTFAGAPTRSEAPARAIEHRVQLQKRQQMTSAPPALRRVVTASNTARIALPPVPKLASTISPITPVTMAGMGNRGLGVSFGKGGGSGGTGGGLSMFGLRDNQNGALAGTFFDLKQAPDGHPTTMAKSEPNGWPTPGAIKEYENAVASFVRGGMNDAVLKDRYFKGPRPLYTTQIYIPKMQADEGPKAFDLEGKVQPSRWLVHYRGTVTAPESGTYRFVGVGDDVLVVRFNGAIVLDCGSIFPSGHKPSRFYVFDGLSNPTGGWFKGCGEGTAFQVQAGRTYPLDVVIGEWPGGDFEAFLQMKREGTEYAKDSHGNPVLPLFRMSTVKPSVSAGEAPVYLPDGPVWQGVASASALP